MPGRDPRQLVRDTYVAYQSGDRSVVEELLADDFVFYSPPDPGIDRATYFERCWPNSETTDAFEFKRLIEAGDEVVVTYELTKTDGRRFRNTEIFGFDGDLINRVEVYFGWDVARRLDERMFDRLGGCRVTSAAVPVSAGATRPATAPGPRASAATRRSRATIVRLCSSGCCSRRSRAASPTATRR
jgi:ketosteroid isomerase-like protein